jgi:predicted regulator of Ras-like GTPase activity (Roadblock/LC7/MglB family)
METSTEALAHAALQELLEVSPQVEAVIVADHGGEVLASLPHAPASAAAERIGSLLVRVLDTAERSRKELGREPVTQCEIGTGDGSVFVVRDARHVIAAFTGMDPTVGLVFYDLKTALRTLRDAASHGSENGAGHNGNGTGAHATAESTGAQG